MDEVWHDFLENSLLHLQLENPPAHMTTKLSERIIPRVRYKAFGSMRLAQCSKLYTSNTLCTQEIH